MALVKWRSPTEELSRMERRIRQAFDEPFRLSFLTEEMGWTPAVEVVETDGAVEVIAELPGMTKDDVEITIENNVLTIRGEKKEEKEEKGKERYLFERFYGSFQRAFTLPVPVDEAKVNADFRNGVLKVHLPKSSEVKGRKVPITQ